MGPLTWTDGNNDATNWSLGAPPKVGTDQNGNPTYQDAVIGGGPGGTVTLNVNTGVKSLTVEASDNTDPGTNYTLAINAPYTLSVATTLKIDQGGEIDVAGSGASLSVTGAAQNAGTLTLTDGGKVVVGAGSAASGKPANFVNYITPNQNEGNIGPTVGGKINVDDTGSGGSSLTIMGTLTNKNLTDGVTGTISVGNDSLTQNATLSAQDFGTSATLDGTVSITGPTGAAGPNVGQATFSLGVGVTTILSSGSLTIDGDNAFLALASKLGSNSALTNLASNAGKLEVDDITLAGKGLTTNGDANTGVFTNTGSIKVTGSEFNDAAINITVAGSGGMVNSGKIFVGGDPANPDPDQAFGDGTLAVTNGAFVQQSGGVTTVIGTSGNEARLQAIGSNVSTAAMDIQANSTLTINDYSSVTVGLDTNGDHRDLSNEGTINVSGSEQSTLNITGNLTNSGTITVASGGYLSVGDNVHNPGSIIVAGTVVTSGNVDNEDLVEIDVGGTYDPLVYSQNAGKTIVNGTLVGTSAINITGGTLAGGTNGGTGTLIGNVNVSGANLTIGGPAFGSLHVEGNFAQTGGKIQFVIGSNGSGGFSESTLILDPGNATTISDANVVFDFVNGADPLAFYKSGDFNSNTFFKESDGSTLTAGALYAMLAGDTFNVESSSYNITKFAFDAGLGATALTETPVPLPHAAWLFLGGLGSLIAIGRRRRGVMPAGCCEPNSALR